MTISCTVDYKELIVGLEVLKDDTIEEKLKIFFDLCDLDGSGKISEKEIFNVLKSNIVSESDTHKKNCNPKLRIFEQYIKMLIS